MYLIIHMCAFDVFFYVFIVIIFSLLYLLSSFINTHIYIYIHTSHANYYTIYPYTGFDPIQTPVSLVQSRGRARHESSSFIILSENNDKKRSYCELSKSEKQQNNVILKSSNHVGCDGKKSGSIDGNSRNNGNFRNDNNNNGEKDDSRNKNNNNNRGNTFNNNNNGEGEEKEYEIYKQKKDQAQKSRIYTALPILQKFITDPINNNALSTLKLYASKVSGELSEITRKDIHNNWSTESSFMQYGHDTIVKTGASSDKKKSKHVSAALILKDIIIQQKIQ